MRRTSKAVPAAPAPARPAAPPPSAWLAASGLRLPAGLACTPLQPVTSARLVTSRSERDRVLAAAARASGLRLDGFFRGAASGGPALPLITAAISTPEAAKWVGCPGRYAVSRKADGTRCLLSVLASLEGADLAGADGGGGGGVSGESSEAYLLNRSGAMYRFPARSSASADGIDGGGSLPAGTLLDGELMWVGGQDFFLAFDALCVGGQRLWNRPLRDRLAALEGSGRGGRGEGLGLQEAEDSVELKAAAAGAKAAQGPATAAARSPALHKKQQAPSPIAAGGDVVCVLRKRQLGVTAEALRDLGASTSACPYPTDGLIFTPYDMPYVLGMAELSYKWQPPEQVGVDLRGTELSHALVLPELVYECLPSEYDVRHTPVDVRWDKAGGNAADVVGRLKALQQRRDCRTFEALAALVGAAQAATQEDREAGEVVAENQQHGAETTATHPARSMSYDDLYGSVMVAVEAGSVERTVDSDSGLEIFNYRPGAPLGPLEALCRGLVLHPPSANLVATAFAKFPELDAAARPRRRPAPSAVNMRPAGGCVVCGCSAEVDDEGERICHCDSCAARGCFAKVEDLPKQVREELERERRRERRAEDEAQLPEREDAWALHPNELLNSSSAVHTSAGGGCSGCPSAASGPGAETEVRSAWAISPQDLLAVTAIGSGARACGSRRGRRGALAAASVKVDGSMIVAFTWGGQLRTATRRRMDSEQAVWAGDWLRRNAHPSAFQPGWTYVLEAVYGNSAVVVPYAFEGLVLLAAVDREGREVPRRELPALAQALGVTMAVPCVEGDLEELLWGLPGVRPAAAAVPPDTFQTRAAKATAQPASKPAPPAFEGWVVAAPDGRRYKLVQPPYKHASRAGLLLHPLSVWDRVCCGGASHASLNEGLPAHFRAELDSILAALSERYGEARAELLRVLRAAAREGRLADLKAPDQAVDEAGDALAALLAQLNLGDGPAAADGSARTSAAAAAVTTSSAAAVGTDLLSSPHFRRALSRAANRVLLAGVLPPGGEVPDDLVPPSMYYAASVPPSAASRTRAAAPQPDPLLRGLLVRCVRPGTDGALPGYTPSPGFAQTWAKGWPHGPVGRMDPSAPPPLLHAALFDELLERCLASLEGRDLVVATQVCERWRRVLSAAPPPGDLAGRLEAGQRAAEAARAAAAAAAEAERLRRRRMYAADDAPYLRGNFRFPWYGSYRGYDDDSDEYGSY